jgi:hypothetical protein
MALVRRTAVDGRPVTAAPATTSLTVPRQPSAADIDEALAAANTPAEEIAAAPDRPARLWAVLLGLAFVAGGGAAAFAIDQAYAVPTLPLLNEAAVIVSLLLAAMVVERALEPFTRWLPGRGARNRYEQQIADLANRLPNATLSSVAAAKARVGQRRAEKSVLTWGVATAVGTVLAAGTGFHLLRMLVAADLPGRSGMPVWADALAAGLIIGSGTKPVHDLLIRLQQGNAQRRDPAES